MTNRPLDRHLLRELLMDRITTTEELFNALDELVQAIDHPLGGDLEINIYWCLESGRAHWEAT